jgi:hypothetical protein
MKRPVNFETINGIDFEMMGHSFHTDLDDLQNKKESSWLWVMPSGSILGDYVVLFELKWEHDCYSMKKCVLGEGSTGNYIFQDHWISKQIIETKDLFFEHIQTTILNEIKTGTFQN